MTWNHWNLHGHNKTSMFPIESEEPKSLLGRTSSKASWDYKELVVKQVWDWKDVSSQRLSMCWFRCSVWFGFDDDLIWCWFILIQFDPRTLGFQDGRYVFLLGLVILVFEVSMCHPKEIPIHMRLPISRILWEANLNLKNKQAMGRLYIFAKPLIPSISTKCRWILQSHGAFGMDSLWVQAL